MIGREFSLSTLGIVANFVLQIVAFIMKMTTLMVSRYMEFSSMSCSEMNLGPTLSTRVNLLSLHGTSHRSSSLFFIVSSPPSFFALPAFISSLTLSAHRFF